MYFKVDNKKNVSMSGFIQNFSWYIHETQVYLKITMASNIDKHRVFTLVTDRIHEVTCETIENVHVL